MPNNCYFETKIAGPEKAVQEFIQMLQWTGPFARNGLGRVFSFDLTVPPEIVKDPHSENISVVGQGDCANSVKNAILDSKPFSLMSETARLGLAVEIYSSDPENFFQEHILACKGNLMINESVHYEEYMIEGSSESYIQEIMEEKGLTREELMVQVNDNGDYCIGGYENFGEFQDLFAYLDIQAERKPALAERIQSAASRAGETSGENKGREPERMD